MTRPHAIPRWLVYTLAAATGYVSLSQEMLWIKIVGFADQGRPETFAHALGFFLIGLAAGAAAGRRVQGALRLSTLRYLAVMVTLSGLIFLLAMPIGAQINTIWPGLGLLTLLVGTALTSFTMGSVFPLLCEEGVGDEQAVGSGVSRVIVANVLGATVGPLLTGFVLLEIETVQHNILLLTLACLAMGQALWWYAGETRHRHSGVMIGAALSVAALVTQPALHHLLIEKLHFGVDGYEPGYRYTAQGRAGFVGVWPTGREYGDGLYDGGFFTDPVKDENLISRAYFVAALHPKPTHVLEIGLGTGSWARVMANDPAIEHLTIVELSHEYVDVMLHYPRIASVLKDPKVELHFDDGRRWMVRHPEAKFEVIVINGTWHWRSGATHILSAEFLQEAKKHLRPGGVVYYNTTGSLDVRYTAAGVFDYVTTYLNFVAASDIPFPGDTTARRAALMRFPGDSGHALFASSAREALQPLLEVNTDNLAPDLRRANDLWYITDDNMATEFKTNGAGKWWRELPSRLFRPERAWPRVLF